MEYVFFTDLRSSKIVEAQKSFLRECRAKIAEATKKVIRKGAQRKFSAQKSLQRECRAKYCRNIRRRSSKVIPKGMQNLYRRNRRRRSSKDVPKGMQNLHRKINGEHRKINGEEGSKDVPKGMQSLCVPVLACGCVSSTSVSFCIISSHHSARGSNGSSGRDNSAEVGKS
jgi:hypothetical protein